MAEDFSADQTLTNKDGMPTAYLEDYMYQLGRSVGVSTPASATAKGEKGTLLADSSYIYVCISTDVWKRVAISTW